ncbi:hypothetical protein MHYP_G00361450 [Metynnis hypsauchen]
MENAPRKQKADKGVPLLLLPPTRSARNDATSHIDICPTGVKDTALSFSVPMLCVFTRTVVYERAATGTTLGLLALRAFGSSPIWKVTLIRFPVASWHVCLTSLHVLQLTT